MPGFFTKVRIQIHLKSYIYCGPDLHNYPFLLVVNRLCMIVSPVSLFVLFNSLFYNSVFIASTPVGYATGKKRPVRVVLS